MNRIIPVVVFLNKLDASPSPDAALILFERFNALNEEIATPKITKVLLGSARNGGAALGRYIAQLIIGEAKQQRPCPSNVLIRFPLDRNQRNLE